MRGSWLWPLQTVILLRPYSLSRVHTSTESSPLYPGEVVAFPLLIEMEGRGRTGQADLASSLVNRESFFKQGLKVWVRIKLREI
jgi:hypothetical protein